MVTFQSSPALMAGYLGGSATSQIVAVHSLVILRYHFSSTQAPAQKGPGFCSKHPQPLGVLLSHCSSLPLTPLNQQSQRL